MMPPSKKRLSDKLAEHDRQIENFKKAARELGCDEDPAHFDEILKKVARHKPREDTPPLAQKPTAQSVASKAQK
jgi:hypothetical protein